MLRSHIGTTRFNNATYEENQRYKREHNITGCIYGLSKKMPIDVRRGEIVYVIEMKSPDGFSLYWG